MSNERVISFLHIFASIWWCHYFYFVHSEPLICISLMAGEAERFTRAYSPSVCPVHEVLVQAFALLLN
jgi:hypothetical protein